MEQIIYLEVDDSILIVRDRLRRLQARNVLLVVPPGCKALTRPLDFCLLRRQAAALRLNLALVSDSATLRDMALEEGLVVFTRLSLGQRVARRSRKWQSKDQPGLEGLIARLEPQRLKWWQWVLGPVTIVWVLGVLVGSGLLVWPSATVQVVPARESIGVSTWVEASIGTRFVDRERSSMPARVVQVEVVDRGEVETTGITNVAADKSVGTVLFVNSTRRGVRIPISTIVSTSAGTPVRFRTVQSAIVDARGRVRISIEALEGGPGGNVRANLINRIEGPLTSSLKVTNETGTWGGSNEQARRVTHGDKQRVSDMLIEKLIQKGHAEISAVLEEEFLPIETMQINQYSIRTNYDHHVDDQSDTLALEMRGIVWGLAISNKTADELARYDLSKQIRQGFHLLPQTIHISRGELVQVDEETGNARFLMEGVALIEADIDGRLLREAIRGRPVDEARAYLRQTLPAETDPTLSVQPDWIPRVPVMMFRITILKGDRSEKVAHALPRS
jgi:hypothetical protein